MNQLGKSYTLGKLGNMGQDGYYLAEEGLDGLVGLGGGGEQGLLGEVDEGDLYDALQLYVVAVF